MADHGVEDREELVHARGERQFFGFMQGEQALLEGSDQRITAGGHEGGHVQRGAHGRPATPDHALATLGATVLIEWRQSNQRSDVLVRDPAEFGQVGQQGRTEHRSNAGRRAEELVAVAPRRAGADASADLLIQVVDLPIEPRHVLADLCSDACRCSARAVLLSNAHLHQLPAASDQHRQFLRRGIWQRPHLRTNRLGEVGQDLGIDAVRFGQLAGGFGEVTRLPGIDCHYRQFCSSQGRDYR